MPITLSKAVARTSTAAQTLQSGYYIWRTVEDGHVRPAHAALNRSIRAWDQSPDPGDDYNCRCWAEPVVIPKDIEPTLQDVLAELSYFDKQKYVLSAKLLRHYLGRTGIPIILKENDLIDKPVVKMAILNNQKRFEDDFLGNIKSDSPTSFKNKILNLANNNQINLSDYWDVDITKYNLNFILDPDFNLAIGSAKIRSNGDFHAQRKDNIIKITGRVTHNIDDVYDFNDDSFIDHRAFENERKLAKNGYAKPYNVHWEKSQEFIGTITLRGGNIDTHNFKWFHGHP